MGTTDSIFVFHSLITHFVNSGKKLFCAFVHFLGSEKPFMV